MKTKILIVEDDLILAHTIKEILCEEEYDCVINFFSPTDAANVIEEHKPSLVIIGLNYKKEVNGLDLGEYLLNLDTVPYIYISSYFDKTSLERVKQTRPYGYLVQPFKPHDLISAVSISISNYRYKKIDIVRTCTNINDDVPFILKKTIKYINDNITEKIQLRELSSLTRWKSQHFVKNFSKYIGVTPNKYIIDRKIEVSKTMIEESTIPITQISYNLGFKSHSNFCSIFKKRVGQTPEQYKKCHNAKKYLSEKTLLTQNFLLI